MLRAALAAAPRPQPEADGIPLAGGLVGYASYDVVRMFERLPSRRPPATTPLMHYVAPASLLVFDHVTRGIALLHAGPEAERASLRREVSRALQGGLPVRGARAGFDRPRHSTRPRPLPRRGAASPGAHRGRRHLPAGALHPASRAGTQLDPFEVYRALRTINPSPYLYFCELDDVTVIGSSPEALVKLNNGIAELRPIAGTRPRADIRSHRSRARGRTALATKRRTPNT